MKLPPSATPNQMLKRLLVSLLVGVMLIAGSVLPGSAISDVGRSEISRLFRSTDEGDRFTCTVSYIKPYVNDYISWVVTAGHCTEGDIVVRNPSIHIRGLVNWRGQFLSHGEYKTKTVDIAIGTVPDVRDGKHPSLWLADKTPDQARVYIHGYPAGIEKVSLGYIAPEFANKRVSFLVPSRSEFEGIERHTIAELFPGTRFMLVKHDEVIGGSSGSPILDDQDRVVGILWGLVSNVPQVEIQGLPPALEGYDVVLFTPIEEVHKLFNSIGVDG